MNKNIKILDCTLRDGGYINNWKFGQPVIKFIINQLDKAGVDFIECGFLTNEVADDSQSLFNDLLQVEKLFPEKSCGSKYTLMINYGQYDIKKLPVNKSNNVYLRLAFKKNDWRNALDHAKSLVEKGYNVFVNPMHTNMYSSAELLELIEKVNKISPYAFSIVDTTGIMKKNNILSLCYLIEDNLDSNIALCFHSHNNLQLSFSNAQVLMDVSSSRELIIDSCVFGMGRGAGNLCTELLLQYVNDNYFKNYDLIPILKIVDEELNKIFIKTPWGYSLPYYLAAVNHCHPSYATYLVDKQTVSVDMVNTVLKAIPAHKKSSYDETLIRQIYLDFQEAYIDDKILFQKINSNLRDRELLILAPGKTIQTQSEKINEFIIKNNPYVIALNFIPRDINIDLVFISNNKRFNSLGEIKTEFVVTSNIKNAPDDRKVNYSNYLNDSILFDNVSLIFLNILIKMGLQGVNFAGLDGFSEVATENYVSENLINNSNILELDKKNKAMVSMLAEFSKNISINILTDSLYNKYKNKDTDNLCYQVAKERITFDD